MKHLCEHLTNEPDVALLTVTVMYNTDTECQTHNFTLTIANIADFYGNFIENVHKKLLNRKCSALRLIGVGDHVKFKRLMQLLLDMLKDLATCYIHTK